MHEHNIREMVSQLVKDNVIPEADTNKAIDSLKKHWEDKIALIWCVEDVIDRAAENGITISNERAAEILAEVYHRHDCNNGVSWDTLDCYIN